MTTRACTIPLSVVKDIMWAEIKEKIKNNEVPHEDDIKFIDETGQHFTVWTEISKDDVLPDMVSVTIMIDNYSCKINEKIGRMSALFSFQNIEDCEIYSNGVQIQNTAEALNELELVDIETFVAEKWNK